MREPASSPNREPPPSVAASRRDGEATVAGSRRDGRATVAGSRRDGEATVAGSPRTVAGEAGQATVEFVALLPLVMAVAFTAAAVLAGHVAAEQAGQAAQAGAMAMLQGGDPREAARRALPAGARGRASIDIEGRRVIVSVRPRLPIEPLAAALTAQAGADAGPEPPP